MRKTDEANSEARRLQIVRAAITCFTRTGLHGTSISQICKEAGVSPAHPYYYFKNKEEIVRQVYQYDWDVATQYLDGLIDEPYGPAIYLGLVKSTRHVMADDRVAGPSFGFEVAAEIGRNPELAAVHADHHKRYMAKIRQIAKASQARGEFVEGASVEDVVFAVYTIATARAYAEVLGIYDEAVYVRRSSVMLGGLLKLPKKPSRVP